MTSLENRNFAILRHFDTILPGGQKNKKSQRISFILWLSVPAADVPVVLVRLQI